MRIDSGLPLQVARAYGLRAAPRTTAAPVAPATVAVPAPPTAPVERPTTAAPIAPARPTLAVEGPSAATAAATGPTGSAGRAERTVGIDRLVAGRVPGGVDFHAASTPTSPAGAYQFYTRAADRLEASVMMRTGARIDVRG